MNRPSTAPRSARVRWLALALVSAFHCGRDSESVPRSDHRVLVIGWDGATFDLLDPLLRAGRLPNLQKLLESGFSAELESTIVPISSAAWTGMTTGRSPGHTGVYSFFEPVPGTYDVELISSRSNHATPVWRTLTRRGLESIVFGVPVTYPPEPLRGVLVAGMLSPFEADYTWPYGLADELRDRGFVPDLGMWRSDRPISDPAQVERQLQIKEQILLELMDERDWSLGWIVFKSLDVLSHGQYNGDPNGRVGQLAARLDTILGRLLEAAGPDTNVLVVSDHGFAAYQRMFHLDTWLLSEGLSVLDRGAGRAGRVGGALADARALEHKRRIDELDMARTVAFATQAEGNFGGIRVNLAGREPQGVVPAAELEATLVDLERRLTELRNPQGEQVITRVLRTADLYPGPHIDLLPDLLIESDPRFAVLSTMRGPVFDQIQGVFPEHARTGVLVGAGPDIARVAARSRASIFDIAPTVLHLLEQSVYADLEGRVLTEVLANSTAPRVVAESEDPADGDLWRSVWERPAELSAEEREELEQRLSATGYVE